MSIFSGRINRKQYFLGCLLSVPLIIISIIIFSIFGLIVRIFFPQVTYENNVQFSSISIAIIWMFYLTFILGTKRFRDTGKSGSLFVWLQILSIFFPPTNIYIIYKLLSKGYSKENEFGPNPNKLKLFEALFNLKTKLK